MSVRAPYKEKAGSESIQLPVDTALFAVLPESVVWKGVTLLKKTEFHVTLLHTRKAAELAGRSPGDITSFFNSFVGSHPIVLASLLGDFRYAEEAEKKAILIHCTVSHLDELFAELNKTFATTMPTQPAHITLYTLQKDAGIHVNSNEMMEGLERVHLPELDSALKNIRLL